jgi:hypothetical protein
MLFAFEKALCIIEQHEMRGPHLSETSLGAHLESEQCTQLQLIHLLLSAFPKAPH